MKKSILLLLLGLSTTAVLAQAPAVQQAQQQAAPRGNTSINGTVVDAGTGKPIEFATVALISGSTGKPIDGTMADGKGQFTIGKVADGQYRLQVSFLGYQLQVVDNVTIAAGNSQVNVGTIALASDVQNLSEVLVQGERPLVEEKIDRTVYNAEKDITNAGGNAADVLQKVPALSLDTDGNVQLRGSGNVRILINNKPSSILAGNVADALKQIPADQIKSVEVITSPSAKYDAEGTAGIINIITKKEGLQGVSGSASVTAGTRASNGNASLSVRRGKFGVNGNFSQHMFQNKGDMINTIVVPADNSVSIQGGDTRINGVFRGGQLGFDYDITPKNSLSGSVRLNGGTFKMQNNQQVNDTENDVVTQNFLNDIRNRNQRQGIDYNLDFTHQFKTPGQELSILSQYSTTSTETLNDQDLYLSGESPYLLQRNTNEGGNDEKTIQVDYMHPFKNKAMLEIGAKGISRSVDSDGLYRFVTPATGAETSTTNAFSYSQDVYATYLTYGFTLKKLLNVKLGGRYEYTDISGDLKTDVPKFSDNYDNFIPSVALSFVLQEKHTFKANFTQRIQRPSFFFLNPYRQQQTSNTAIQGNPNLDAELTNLYELGYSTYFNTTSLSATAYMRQTDNAIESVAIYDEEANSTLITFSNIAKNKTYGVSLFGNTKPINAWTIGGSGNLYFVDLNSSFYDQQQGGKVNYGNSGWQYNINMNTSYDFGSGFSAQFNGGFNSQRLQLLGKFASFSYHSLAFKKELFGKKGGISLGLDNPFRSSMRMKNEVHAIATPTNPREYFQNMLMNNYNRGFKVTLDYRFGKMEQSKPRRKKSIRNDDAKQGEGNGVG